MIDIRKALNDQFLTFLNEIGVKRESHKLLLGFSGGVDSVGLALLLKYNNFNFTLMHMNFQLRGIESDIDEKFCKAFADKYDIDILTKKVETNKIVEETKESIQMVARKLRYDWFEDIKIKEKFDFICTAHHMSDHVETILFNLIKGTGIEGLHGILKRRGDLIRPLRFMTKQEVIKLVENNNQEWREDKSNANSKYARNKIRNLIIPLMKEINPKLEHSITTSSHLFKETENVLFDRLDSFKKEVSHNNESSLKLDLEKLKSENDLFLLYYFLKPYKFDYSTTKNLFSQKAKTGLQFYSSDKKYVINTVKGKGLLIENVEDKHSFSSLLIGLEPNQYVFNSLQLTLENKEVLDYKSMMEDNTIYIDVSFFPLKLRNVIKGDRIRPFGMKKGKKKVYDLLQDENIPSYIRDNFLVIESKEQEILSVLGVRNSESLRITNFPCKLIKITMKKL